VLICWLDSGLLALPLPADISIMMLLLHPTPPKQVTSPSQPWLKLEMIRDNPQSLAPVLCLLHKDMCRPAAQAAVALWILS
jgi:hypothetical protein